MKGESRYDRRGLIGRGEGDDGRVNVNELTHTRGMVQPPLFPRTVGKAGRPALIGFEHFAHTTRALGLVGSGSGPHVEGIDGAGRDSVSARQLAVAAEQVCHTSWDSLRVHREGAVGESAKKTRAYPNMRQGHEHKFCFSATFLSVFMSIGLGIPPDQPVPMLGSIADVEIDWALGLVLSRAEGLRSGEWQSAEAAARPSHPSPIGADPAPLADGSAHQNELAKPPSVGPGSNSQGKYGAVDVGGSSNAAAGERKGRQGDAGAVGAHSGGDGGRQDNGSSDSPTRVPDAHRSTHSSRAGDAVHL